MMPSRFAFLAVVSALSLPLHAQGTRGQIIGRVTDATGAVLVGAQVKGVNSDTNVATAATTSGTGDFVLPFLTPYNPESRHEGDSASTWNSTSTSWRMTRSPSTSSWNWAAPARVSK